MKVKFSGSIASLFEGQRELEWEGHSTRALFSELQQRYPKLSETLFLPSGTLQALEVIKLLTGIGKPLSRRLLLKDAGQDAEKRV